MTEADTREILMLIDGNSYSDFKVNSIETTIKVWQMSLGDYDYPTVMFALKEYFKTGGHFAPKPSDLIEIIHSASDFEYMTEQEISTLIMKAVRNSAYNSQKEFDKLPPLAQRTCGSASQLRMWATDENFNQDVIESNIQRTYKQVLKQEKELKRMSPEMKMLANNFFEKRPAIDPPKESRQERLICTAQFDDEKPSEEVVTGFTDRLRGILND